jgi:hypothetical protein
MVVLGGSGDTIGLPFSKEATGELKVAGFPFSIAENGNGSGVTTNDFGSGWIRFGDGRLGRKVTKSNS